MQYAKPHNLSIIVVGAGIGGLACALGLRRRGHNVTVLEQAPRLSEVGAGIQLAPNANKALFGLGLREPLEREAVAAQSSVRRRWETGEVLGAYPLGREVEDRFGAPYWHIHRSDLHSALVEAAVGEHGAGPPVAMRLGTTVVDVEPEPERGAKAAAVTADGTRHLADALIGADGIHSLVRAAIVGADRPRYSGDVAYRALIPAAGIERSPDLLAIAGEPDLTIWLGPGAHVVHYYVRRRTMLNLVAIVPGEEPGTESWSAKGSVAELRASLEGWDPRLHDLLGEIPAVNRWALYDREPLDSWTAGRVALLGDSCHPMLPYQAQGAAQAIEDAVALAEALDQAVPEEVPVALRAYEAARQERAAAVQGASRGNRALFHLPDGEEQRRRDLGLQAQAADFESYSWLWEGRDGPGPSRSALAATAVGEAAPTVSAATSQQPNRRKV